MILVRLCVFFLNLITKTLIQGTVALFERVAEVRGWTDSYRTLLLQCIFTGMSQRAFSALNYVESGNYAKVKVAFLKAYEFVPEAFRQKFKNWKKGAKQTYVEICPGYFGSLCSLVVLFCSRKHEDWCELIVLEQLKSSLPAHLATYVNKKKLKTASTAALMAEENLLSHAIGSVECLSS